jgi:hypothetical protein
LDFEVPDVSFGISKVKGAKGLFWGKQDEKYSLILQFYDCYIQGCGFGSALFLEAGSGFALK